MVSVQKMRTFLDTPQCTPSPDTKQLITVHFVDFAALQVLEPRHYGALPYLQPGVITLYSAVDVQTIRAMMLQKLKGLLSACQNACLYGDLYTNNYTFLQSQAITEVWQVANRYWQSAVAILIHIWQSHDLTTQLSSSVTTAPRCAVVTELAS